ncbi:MAG: hypothetical protein FIA89_00075 [Geobacter sp.]|nr:hypothetical protein [Geobacter sp.]
MSRFRRSPPPMTAEDRGFMQYLLEGVRRKREEAVRRYTPIPAPDPDVKNALQGVSDRVKISATVRDCAGARGAGEDVPSSTQPDTNLLSLPDSGGFATALQGSSEIPHLR